MGIVDNIKGKVKEKYEESKLERAKEREANKIIKEKVQVAKYKAREEAAIKAAKRKERKKYEPKPSLQQQFSSSYGFKTRESEFKPVKKRKKTKERVKVVYVQQEPRRDIYASQPYFTKPVLRPTKTKKKKLQMQKPKSAFDDMSTRDSMFGDFFK
jgi:hypothetical protein